MAGFSSSLGVTATLMQGKFPAYLLQKDRLYTLDFVIYGFGRVLNTHLPSSEK